MKNKTKIIIIISVMAVLIAGIFLALFIFRDKNKLTVNERNWINNNTKTVLNINFINDANIFGNNGSGVFYDFIDDFVKEYNLTINPITYNGIESKSGISFAMKNNVGDDDIVFYTDHYVLLSKNKMLFNSIEDISGKTIGVIAGDEAYVSPYLTNDITFKEFENKASLLTEFNGELEYIIVPMNYYLDDILLNNYEIVYHLSDIKSYYTLQLANDTLSSILKKFYSKWDKFDDYYDKDEFDLFIDKLTITDSEVDAIRSINYSYGFVNTSPYEVIKGGTYGGIIAVILKEFSDFSGVEFKFERYKNYDKFVNAIENRKINLYFNRYSLNNEWSQTDNVFNIKYSIIANRDNNINFNSVNSLKGFTIYVEENSMLYDYLIKVNGINIKTYANENELFKLNKKDSIIVIDSHIFEYYSKTKLDNYTERNSDYIDVAYTFKVDTNGSLYKLLNKYVNTLDKNVIYNEGIANHYDTMKSGVLLSTIAKYIIYLILIAIIVLLLAIKRTRKIAIAKKIKRDDKLKFIDQLTSLKNRNYLNECLETWNNNTIYPQTVVVVDLNGIQEINDINGYSEGDKQIKSCANILIKTQLDNSEVMRTDGNEFVIYLVGYNQKQITNYIHKLNREMEDLPYNNGAEFGYSIIENDLKTIEDALNEAVEEMKKQKKGARNEEKN